MNGHLPGSFALLATGTGQPWPPHAPEVGFSMVTETYYEENVPDCDKWVNRDS